MASFFNKLSDDMERVAQVVQEGAKFAMGESTHMGGHGNDATTTSDPTFGGGGDGARVEDGDAIFEGMDDIEDAYGSPLMGMADNVMSDIMSTQIGPQTPKEHIQAFVAAITWKEPFIIFLLAFHAVVIATALVLNRKGGTYTRMGLMIFVGIIIRLSEWLNGIGANRWREFATQNYFDRSGTFMAIMLCAPLLMVCVVMLISMTREASNLLVDVKQMKIDAQIKQKQKKENEEKKDEKKRRKKGQKKD